MHFEAGTRGGLGSRAWLIAALLAVLALALSACGSDDEKESAGSGDAKPAAREKIRVVLPSPSIMAFFPYWVADNKGYFKEENLDVSVNAADGSSSAQQLFAAGEADIVEATSNDIFTAAKQLDFQPVMVLKTWVGQPIGVYGGPDSGITGPADLKGKTVGVGNVTAIEAVLTKATAIGAGLKPDDVKLLAVGGAGQAVAAFERGDIDAFAGGIQDVALVGARGVELTRIDPREPIFYMGAWASKKNLDAKSEAYRGFTRALKKSFEFINKDPNKLQEWAKSVDPTSVPPGKAGPALAKTVIGVRFPESLDQLGQVKPEDFEKVFNRSKEDPKNALKGEATDFYTTEYLPK